MLKRAKLTYSPFKKAFKKHGEKQVESLESLRSFQNQLPLVKIFISGKRLNPEIIKKLQNIKVKEQKKAKEKCFIKDVKLSLIL